MYELNTVAIVRYCRAKNALPKLGFLSPHIKQDYEVTILRLLYLNVISKVRNINEIVTSGLIMHNCMSVKSHCLYLDLNNKMFINRF